MLNLVSIVVGLLALPFVLVGVVPYLGAVNYLAVPIAIVGLLLGVLSSRNSGRNFNLVVLILAFIRLWAGGGIL
ncbi:hypothetical protein [Sphingomonas aracearum]|uniref:Uncharacterized protein n=1 Tax=Sphingomonas aracearum TaxID=2283317 RepID=A0A369VUY0_9SPHN|nr:hypothetical protein [Sphingomonas aracearum]RDE06186.1 hypothetical protein DVW87_00115 [Sphingomonas aracearum]